MDILRKLLDNLGDMWNTVPKELPFIVVKRGSAPLEPYRHTLMSVDEGVLYFHSMPFRKDMPESQRQAFVLDVMTIQGLLDAINELNYEAYLHPDAIDAGLNVNKPFILSEVKNVPMGSTLYAFTSNLWAVMYPIYRVLRQAHFNTSVALRQLYRDLAEGEWLDFWASFFSITRLPGESDETFARRFTMWLFNPKTNNIALKELLAYQLQDTNFDVRDRPEPLTFEVYLGVKYISDASALHRILQQTKAAGVTYFLNYVADPHNEYYPLYVSDAIGEPWTTSDRVVSAVSRLLAEEYASPSDEPGALTAKALEETYEIPSGQTPFQLGSSELNNPTEGEDELFDPEALHQEECIVTMVSDGVVIWNGRIEDWASG